jgi:dihydropteroate synthase
MAVDYADSFMSGQYDWRLSRSVLRLGERTAVMGILNVTPDSFSDGGQYFDPVQAIARGKDIEQQGADIVDIGGESSRPGSEAVSEEEETRRVLPVIEALAGVLAVPISVDTYRSGVARRAIEAGAQIVNDISAFRFDEEMPGVVKRSGAAIVLMHSRGSRSTLHKQSRMGDAMREVLEGLSASVDKALKAGISRDAIVIDPGIGFGKAADESLTILKRLNEFSKLRYPLLVGTSRKSFIRSIVQDTPESRSCGTAATVVVAIMNGAHIVRVHDVLQGRVLADITDQLAGAGRTD